MLQSFCCFYLKVLINYKKLTFTEKTTTVVTIVYYLLAIDNKGDLIENESKMLHFRRSIRFGANAAPVFTNSAFNYSENMSSISSLF